MNLGSPKSTKVEDVKEYLDEFLMDERVIDYRWFFRALLVKGIILKTRPKKSAAAYKTVWTEEGSPLVVITKQIQQKLQKLVDVPVEIGMRYAEPSIETGIRNLVEKGVEEIVLFPLYPQYAMSTTETVVEKAKEVQAKFFPNVKINYVKPFYNRDIYINCLAESIKEKLPENFDLLQFSYHGVPERHIYKTDPTKTCKIGDCCFKEDHPSHQYCYRHQCLKTTELVKQKLGSYGFLADLNPLTPIFECFKYGFIGSGDFDMVRLLTSFAFIIGILFVGIVIFNKSEKSFIDTV